MDVQVKHYSKKELPKAEILLQPNIPKPLHGLNPRSIKGNDWWDKKRQEAYAYFDYRCWACGITKYKANFFRWLEGHESYYIDYDEGYATLVQILALCHSCHNFIHNGRLYMTYYDRKISLDKYLTIMHHGFTVLKNAELPPNWYALFSLHNFIDVAEKRGEKLPEWVYVGRNKFMSMDFADDDDIAPWQNWYIEIDGTKYHSKFETYGDWYEHYRGKPFIDERYSGLENEFEFDF